MIAEPACAGAAPPPDSTAMGTIRDPRAHPELRAAERTMLEQFLDQQRAAMLDHLDGLTDAELALAAVPGCTLTIGGLVNHLARVEDVWFHVRLLGNEPLEPWASAPAVRDWDFGAGAAAAGDVLRERYSSAWARSRSAADACSSLDDPSALPSFGKGPVSLRWVLVHMIEETATHRGHADLVRDAVVAARRG